jgi:hypothetical protein
MDTIYTAPDGYTITLTGARVTIAKGAQTQKTRLTPARELSPSQTATVKKAGQNPSAFFSNADNVIIRAAAREAWDAAVASERVAKKTAAEAEKQRAAAEIATDGQRALVLHGPYLIQAALVWVRPATDAETTRLSPEYRAIGLYRPLGDWTALDRRALDGFAMTGRERRALTTAEENSVILISEDEWTALLAASEAARQTSSAKKAAAAQAESDRLAAAQAEAARTGVMVEIARQLIETETEDGLVLLRTMIRGDGTRTTLRTICG